MPLWGLEGWTRIPGWVWNPLGTHCTGQTWQSLTDLEPEGAVETRPAG